MTIRSSNHLPILKTIFGGKLSCKILLFLIALCNQIFRPNYPASVRTTHVIFRRPICIYCMNIHIFLKMYLFYLGVRGFFAPSCFILFVVRTLPYLQGHTIKYRFVFGSFFFFFAIAIATELYPSEKHTTLFNNRIYYLVNGCHIICLCMCVCVCLCMMKRRSNEYIYLSNFFFVETSKYLID